MTVKELKDLMDEHDDGTHVVVAALPQDGALVVPKEGTKFEIDTAWEDGRSVLNLIVTTKADQLDPELRAENGL